MRVDASLKTDVERILHALGISTTEAINMFLNRVRLSKGIPFSVQMTDDEFRRYLAECPLDDEAISQEEDSSIKAVLGKITEGKVKRSADK